MGRILNSLKQQTLTPELRQAIRTYENLFRGFFQPVFTLTIRNDGRRSYVFREIVTEIKRTMMWAGEDDKAKIPIAATYDIDVKPELGVGLYKTSIPMEPELRIYPSGSTDGPDVISFNIRLNPQSPYLHYYLMRFRIVTDDNKEIATPLFEIDM